MTLQLNFFDNSILDLVPIIIQYIFYESDIAEDILGDVIHFMRHLSKNAMIKIEKKIILNGISVISSGKRNGNSHVFINLLKEYALWFSTPSQKIFHLAKRKSNEVNLIDRMETCLKEKKNSKLERKTKKHLQNSQIMNDILFSLPNADTGLVTTIESVVLLLDTSKLSIYNLLANRSSISSSLPRFKRCKETSSEESFKCEDGLESDVKKITNI